MVAFNKFETFVGDLGNGTHDLRAAGDQLDVYLFKLSQSSAKGKIEIVVESAVNSLDVAELSVIVTGAGSVFTGQEDRVLNVDTRAVLVASSQGCIEMFIAHYMIDQECLRLLIHKNNPC